MKSLIIFALLVCSCIVTESRRFSTLPMDEVTGTSTVTLVDGPVTGLTFTGGRAFLGIPYAAPPVDDLRWAPPQNPAQWSSPLNATHFAPACPQDCALPPFTCSLAGDSEACLTLDVYTLPASQTGGPKPVMLFYYGGDYIQGTSSTSLYSGIHLVADSNVVLVAINYRLGALAFLHTKNLEGNYGVMDQNKALVWVKNNIAKFGGDPQQVTIFGQSAGAMSVASHLVSKPAQGLFHAAIMESNPIAIAYSTEHNALKMADKFAAALNCDASDTACLRSRNVTDVLAAQLKGVRVPPSAPLQVFVPWLPWVDGHWIVDQPLTAFASGNFNQVPVVLGTVQDEGIMFVMSGFPSAVPFLEYTSMLAVLFGTHVNQVITRFPCNDHSDCRPAMNDLATQYVFACPNRNATRSLATQVPTFLYHYNHVINANGADVWGPDYAYCEPFSCHGSELPFVFQSMELPPSPYKWGPGEKTFAQQVSAYWGNFAQGAHSPNKPNSVPSQWPQYSTSQDANILLATNPGIQSETGYLKDTCDFFDTIGYGHGTFY